MIQVWEHIDPSRAKLYFNDIYHCYSYCINITLGDDNFLFTFY